MSFPTKVDPEIAARVASDYSIESNKSKVNSDFDIFICSAGYEQRTVAFTKYPSRMKCRNSIILLYHPRETALYLKNLENLQVIKNWLSDRSENPPEIIEVEPTDPWKFKEVISGTLKKYLVRENTTALVDITSFTRVFLYELIKALYTVNFNFTIVYSEPADYTDTMAAGVNKLVISPSFMGKPRTDNKTFLLLFFGWETGRSKDTFDNFNSDDHLAVLGVEPIDDKHIRWQHESYKRNKELTRSIVSIQPCPTLELENILKFIVKVYNDKMQPSTVRYDFAICGFGPKIQNVAICFFALLHKDVQLVYGAPSYWGASVDIHTEIPVESHGIGTIYTYGPFSRDIINKLVG